ncbi:WD40 repeat domain-containing protein [Sulfurimonas lithotrophica]|uniref:WD40 repeat domain-containing protein n=1 Tax=Sulfurimonas lithotrophica TaxID=2590022 RepID=A0A5P8P1Z0_9BACT|nr:WD40 repeat domain-containing protein [Sulfurimonas lithotrophica]QFR49742.1 WD40 repeat domain-containing protein [Sulfurimonas lithotrophica]
MRKVILFFLILSSVYSAQIKPSAKFVSSGGVVDLITNKDKIYSATSAGIVDIFDINTQKKVKSITLPKIKDFMGDMVDAKIYSVDKIDDKLLILSQGSGGYSRAFIYENEKLTSIIDESSYMAIIKAKFINKNTIVFGLLSNEIISFDIKTKKRNWTNQASGAKFSNLVINEDKSEIVIADESGILKIMSAKDGKILKKLKGQNLDNVFQVDYKNGIIATAGQDRRVVIYATKFDSAYYKEANFLIYSVGLSPSGKLAGYSSDENNNISVFNTITKRKIGTYTDNKMTLTNIVFIDENRMLGASDDKTINLYKIK